jgi:hypothetical protein
LNGKPPTGSLDFTLDKELKKQNWGEEIAMVREEEVKNFEFGKRTES